MKYWIFWGTIIKGLYSVGFARLTSWLGLAIFFRSLDLRCDDTSYVEMNFKEARLTIMAILSNCQVLRKLFAKFIFCVWMKKVRTHEFDYPFKQDSSWTKRKDKKDFSNFDLDNQFEKVLHIFRTMSFLI